MRSSFRSSFRESTLVPLRLLPLSMALILFGSSYAAHAALTRAILWAGLALITCGAICALSEWLFLHRPNRRLRREVD